MHEKSHPNEKIGVYVCHCGSNIAGTVEVEEVAKWAAEQLKHRGVVIARDYKFMCLQPRSRVDRKRYQGIGAYTRRGSCLLPHLHELTFRTACKNAGLNPYLCELVSIREQCSWVHTDKVAATEKSKAIIAGGVERVVWHEPLIPLKSSYPSSDPGGGWWNCRHSGSP